MDLKVFIILSMLAGIAVAASIITAESISSQISINQDQVICDGLVCPESSTGCTVRKSNDKENSTIVNIVRTCVDKNGNVTEETKDYMLLNTPQCIDVYASSGTGTSSSNNIELNAAQKTKIKEIADQVQQEVVDAVKNVQQYLQHLGVN